MGTLSRRAILRGIGAGAASVPFLTGVGAAERAPPFVRPGVNRVGGNANVVAASDPATGRGRVAHVTGTSGYATTVKPLNVALGDVETLTYEYYESSANGAAPDEVWLYVEDTDGDRHTIWHTSNDDKATNVADEEWQTRNVHREMWGDPDPEDNPNFYWFELTDGGRSALPNDDGDDDHVANLVDHFGEDATLLRLGAGRNGTPTTDVYFRDLELNGHSRGNFPVSGVGEHP